MVPVKKQVECMIYENPGLFLTCHDLHVNIFLLIIMALVCVHYLEHRLCKAVNKQCPLMTQMAAIYQRVNAVLLSRSFMA